MQTHVDELVDHPQRHFAHPEDVLNDPELCTEDKRRILESWKLDAMRLSDSTAENMSGGEEEDLRSVSKSLIQLQTMDTAPVATQHPRSARLGLVGGLLLGAMLGAGLGLIIMTLTTPLTGVVVQTTLIGMILGGVVASLKATVRT